jgi:glutaredoxin
MSLFRTACLFGLLGLAIFGATDASAQQIYRIVGPDGKVTFSDKPPLDPNARPSALAAAPQGGGAGNSALPFELREAANRFPVVLYTGPQCGPCGTGRSLLITRGIPFTEKTVTTNEDIGALGRLTGAPTLPVLTIGEQQLKGYSEVEWARFLDAAGYPKNSLLPPGYAGPPPTPLVAVQRAQPTPKAAPDQSAGASAQPETATAPEGDNPAGIRF